jgi:hypothetical protein
MDSTLALITEVEDLVLKSFRVRDVSIDVTLPRITIRIIGTKKSKISFVRILFILDGLKVKTPLIRSGNLFKWLDVEDNTLYGSVI